MRVAKCQGILSFWRGNLANVRPLHLPAFLDLPIDKISDILVM